MPRGEKDRVKALEKGLNLLLLLEQREEPVSLEVLTRESGLNKTTCFRLIKTLQDFGFAEQVPNSKLYRLGPRNVSLGAAAMKGMSLRRLALPFMERLREMSGETVNLSVLDGAEVVFVERMEAGHIVSTHHRIGDRLPVHCTCMGKAILAFLPESRLDSVLARINFDRKTEKTLQSVPELLEELKRIRREEAAYNLEELEKGLCAVAAPIRNYTGEAVAAVNVAFPLVRHDRETALGRFAPEVKKTAEQISKLLGFSGSGPDGRKKETEKTG